ncbi:MAG: hypothetical protein GY903_11700 [Fuerstiella sp.]|nr:hypothetical protein [Fuerstiella sp.]
MSDPQGLKKAERVRLVIESAHGPITPGELDCYRRFVRAVRIPENNHDKQFAWSTSKTMRSLAIIYRITGDAWYLDRLVSIVDHVLLTRNDPQAGFTDYVTGRRLPTWPNLNVQYSVDGRSVHYSNVVQTGMILYPIAETARLIVANPTLHNRRAPVEDQRRKETGGTYLNKAILYIDRCNETISAFIDDDQWYDVNTRLFRYPDSERHEELLPGAKGLPLPYNRMFAMGRPMLEIAETLKALDKRRNGGLIDRYYEILRAMIAYFFHHLERHGHGDEAYYTWMYRSFGKGGRPPTCEDVGHLGVDVRALLLFHHEGEHHLGITREDLKRIGNTYRHVIHDSATGRFSRFMDGSGQSEHPRSDEMYFQRCIGLAPFEPRLYDICAQSIVNNAGPKSDLIFAEFLNEKNRCWLETSQTSSVGHDP